MIAKSRVVRILLIINNVGMNEWLCIVLIFSICKGLYAVIMSMHVCCCIRKKYLYVLLTSQYSCMCDICMNILSWNNGYVYIANMFSCYAKIASMCMLKLCVYFVKLLVQFKAKEVSFFSKIGL